jgi:hypothetical protein
MNLQNIQCERCHKKHEPGRLISRFADMWLCGECLIIADKNIRKMRKEMLLKE